MKLPWHRKKETTKISQTEETSSNISWCKQTSTLTTELLKLSIEAIFMHLLISQVRGRPTNRHTKCTAVKNIQV